MELLTTDPITWRGLERLIVALGAIVFAFLGYKMYALGIAAGPVKVEVKSRLVAFAVSGTGPGLVFMALGAMILVSSMLTGGASQTITQEIIASIKEDVTEDVLGTVTLVTEKNNEQMKDHVQKSVGTIIYELKNYKGVGLYDRQKPSITVSMEGSTPTSKPGHE